MAEYSFGQNILRYIQNQDELNLRAKQLATEDQRYKTQQSFNERQAELTGARWSADYMLKIQKEQADQENAFNKDNTILNALPEDVRKQIPTEAYKYKGKNIYVPNEVVTNLEQGNQRALDLQKEKNDELYRTETLKNQNDSERIQQQNANTSRLNSEETKRHNLVMESKGSGDGSNTEKGIAPLSVRAKLTGNVSANLEEWNRSGGFRGDNYIKWKKSATGNVSELLKASGLPINGKVVNEIRAALTSERVTKMMDTFDIDEREAKRKILDESIRLYSETNPLEDFQLEALGYFKELQTK